MLIICDRQSSHVRHEIIGSYHVVELEIFKCGLRWDKDAECFVMAEPETWLSPRMLARLIGTPIVFIDAQNETNVPAFPGNVVGVVLSAKGQGETCIASCRIIQPALAKLLEDFGDELHFECDIDVLEGEDKETIEIDGDTVIVAPPPRLVNCVRMTIRTGE